MLQLRRHFEKSIMNSKFRTLKDKYHLWDNTTNVPTVDFNAFYNYLEKTICKYTGGSFFIKMVTSTKDSALTALHSLHLLSYDLNSSLYGHTE